MRRFFVVILSVLLAVSVSFFPAYAIVLPGQFPDIAVGGGEVPESSDDPQLAPMPSDDPVPSVGPSSDYLPPDDFFTLYDDYSVQVIAVQTNPNTPVTSATGLKGILINLLGSYDPTVTQFRYQSNTSTNYTYVNDISPDYPWLCAAAVFAIVLYCTFKLGGTFLCKA